VEWHGLGGIQDHLENLARRQSDNFSTSRDFAPERAMLDRLSNSDYLEKQRRIHQDVERKQNNTWRDRYHPDVVRQYPDLFPSR
jgi:hypothetical protein